MFLLSYIPGNPILCGKTSQNSTAVTWEAANGWSLDGPGSATCRADGTWSSPAPKCEQWLILPVRFIAWEIVKWGCCSHSRISWALFLSSEERLLKLYYIYHSFTARILPKFLMIGIQKVGHLIFASYKFIVPITHRKAYYICPALSLSLSLSLSLYLYLSIY